MELLKTFLFLFALVDPIGTVPVYLEATKHFDKEARARIALKAPAIALGILLFFILAGQVILEGMSITLYAFQVSGGVILFLFALTMVFGTSKPDEEKQLITDYDHVTVFPLALPSIASPGAIMGVVMLTDNHLYSVKQQFITAVLTVLVLVVTVVILRYAGHVQSRIGGTGIIVISKVMGLILAAFAMQSILTGVKSYFSL
ncbi:MAG: MarC family protein [Flavobacteriales bacterium]|jgi:multiple antibiotic resistance protein|nr:MarC family protein [Flavobacteriales bacterium]